MRGAQPVQRGRGGWAVHRRPARPRVLGAPAAPCAACAEPGRCWGVRGARFQGWWGLSRAGSFAGSPLPTAGRAGGCPSRDAPSVTSLHMCAHTQRSHTLMITLTCIHNCTQIHRRTPTHTLTAVPSCAHLTFTHSRLRSHPLSQVHKQPHIRITHLNPTHLTHSHEHLNDLHWHVITHSVTHPH